MIHEFKEGIYYINKPIELNTIGSVLSGQGSGNTIIKIKKDYKYDCFVNAIPKNSSDKIGHIIVKNIKFDASECDKIVHGIKFDSLIYNNLFLDIDFESFTGSWFYNKSNNISEHIEWNLIQGNCRNKIYKSPLFKLDRINESSLISCKFFGKQYKEKPYSNIPLVKLDTPQNINIFSCSFNNTHGIPIDIKTSYASHTRLVNILCCSFEHITQPDNIMIDICGNENWEGEYGKIADNMYIEIDNPVINIDNYNTLQLNDNKASVVLNKNTKNCIVFKTLNNNTTVKDFGTNNNSILFNNNSIILRGKAGNELKFNSNSNAIMFNNYTLMIDNNKFNIKKDRMTVLNIDKEVTFIPSNDISSTSNNSIFVYNNKLYFKINNKAKEVKLGDSL